MASTTVVTGRPSMDSIRTRADSGGANGRMVGVLLGNRNPWQMQCVFRLLHSH